MSIILTKMEEMRSRGNLDTHEIRAGKYGALEEFKRQCDQFWCQTFFGLINNDKFLGSGVSPYESADKALIQYKERFTPK